MIGSFFWPTESASVFLTCSPSLFREGKLILGAENTELSLSTKYICSLSLINNKYLIEIIERGQNNDCLQKSKDCILHYDQSDAITCINAKNQKNNNKIKSIFMDLVWTCLYLHPLNEQNICNEIDSYKCIPVEIRYNYTY